MHTLRPLEHVPVDRLEDGKTYWALSKEDWGGCPSAFLVRVSQERMSSADTRSGIVYRGIGEKSPMTLFDYGKYLPEEEIHHYFFGPVLAPSVARLSEVLRASGQPYPVQR